MLVHSIQLCCLGSCSVAIHLDFPYFRVRDSLYRLTYPRIAIFYAFFIRIGLKRLEVHPSFGEVVPFRSRYL